MNRQGNLNSLKLERLKTVQCLRTIESREYGGYVIILVKAPVVYHFTWIAFVSRQNNLEYAPAYICEISGYSVYRLDLGKQHRS